MDEMAAKRNAGMYRDTEGREFVPTTDRQDEVTWEMKFEALQSYGREHGTCNVPQGFQCVMCDGILVNLGKWLCTQRVDYKKNSLKSNRLAQLQRLSDEGMFDWEPIQHDDRFWYEKLQLVVDFAKKNGHTAVPKDMVYTPANGEGPEVKIRNWLASQVSARRKGLLKDSRLDAFQKGLVEPGYLQWDRKTEGDDAAWTKKYQALIQIGEQVGSCNILENFVCKVDDESVRLGSWVFQQRLQFKKGIIKPERSAQLQELVDRGIFKWDGSGGAVPESDEEFDLRYAAVVQYANEHGNTTIPDLLSFKLADGSDCILGRWCARQKKKQVAGTLRSDREARLQKLVDAGKFSWTKNSKFTVPNEPSFSVCEKMLEAFEGMQGHCNVPKDATAIVQRGKNFEFGYWLNVQRASFRAKRFANERQQYFQNLINRGALNPLADEVDGPSVVFPFDGGMRRHELVTDLMDSFDLDTASNAQLNEISSSLTALLDHIQRTKGNSLQQLISTARQFEPSLPMPLPITAHSMGSYASATSSQSKKRPKSKDDEPAKKKPKYISASTKLTTSGPASVNSAYATVTHAPQRQAFVDVNGMPQAIGIGEPILLGAGPSSQPLRVTKEVEEPVKLAGRVSHKAASAMAGNLIAASHNGPAVMVIDPAAAAAAAHGKRKGPKKKESKSHSHSHSSSSSSSV